MQQMNKKIEKYTMILSLICSLICAFVFHSQMIQVFIAVWIGCATGLFGYHKIVQMALNIPADEGAGKKVGTQEYMKRYFMYGFVLVVCQLMKLPILAVLAGLMCNKGAILLYALKEKEDFHE